MQRRNSGVDARHDLFWVWLGVPRFVRSHHRFFQPEIHTCLDCPDYSQRWAYATVCARNTLSWNRYVVFPHRQPCQVYRRHRPAGKKKEYCGVSFFAFPDCSFCTAVFISRKRETHGRKHPGMSATQWQTKSNPVIISVCITTIIRAGC